VSPICQKLSAGGKERPPHGQRLVVAWNAGLAAKDGRVQSVGRQLPFVDQQRPGKGNGLALEVVAKREIAEHLEERVVAERGADVVEIVVLPAHAHALLSGRGPRVLAPFTPEEHVLELIHAGVREEERRILVRHERRAWNGSVAVPLEIAHKRGAKGLGSHRVYCTTRKWRGVAYDPP
jgi:hypothetical protein